MERITLRDLRSKVKAISSPHIKLITRDHSLSGADGMKMRSDSVFFAGSKGDERVPASDHHPKDRPEMSISGNFMSYFATVQGSLASLYMQYPLAFPTTQLPDDKPSISCA